VTQILEEAGRDPATFTFGHAIDYGPMAGGLYVSHSAVRADIVFGFEPEPILDHIGEARGRGMTHMAVRSRDRAVSRSWTP
jgi:hypothetical protein